MTDFLEILFTSISTPSEVEAGLAVGVAIEAARLSALKAEMIRRMWGKDGIDKHEIASRLNLSWAQVHDVIAGRSWQLGP